jgi:hypothetical protein
MTEARREYIRSYQNSNRVQVYPGKKNLRLIKAYTSKNNMSESALIKHAIRRFFESLPAHERPVI